MILLALIPFGVAMALALHHFYVHYPECRENEKAHQESCPLVCYFQPSDVENHETWIVLCLGVGVTWILATAYYTL
jgi:hypothetical protein